MSQYQDGNWKIFKTEDGLVNNNIKAILESSDEALWFGTEGGVCRYRENIWKTFTGEVELAGNIVWTILASNDSVLWFGTNLGLTRYQNGKWTTFNTYNFLKNNDVRAIFASSDGAKWFGTNGGGVTRYQDHDSLWTTFTVDSGLADNHVFAIEAAGDGGLWFGTFGGGVSRYQNNSWTTFNTDSGLINNKVFAIKAASDNALWFGTLGGVSKYQNGIWINFTVADGLVNDTVRAIEEHCDGALWFGTPAGASRYRNGNWTSFTSASGLAHNYVTEIKTTRDGALWFGTKGGGASRYQDNTWTTFSESSGSSLADKNVQAIEEAGNGAIWFGTKGGASRLKPDRSPPVTFIIQAPRKLTGTPTPVFIFGGSDFRTPQDQLFYSHAVVRYSSLPDSSDWQPYTNLTAIQTQFLENGTYRFYVRARDTWRNVDKTPAIWTFTVDITQPTVVINYPKQEQHIKAEFPIIGSAFDNSPYKDFKHYQLSCDSLVIENQVSEWTAFTDSISLEVKDDTLGILNTTILNDGIHWIRLWAKDTLKHTSEDIVRVTVDNTTPQVEITFPQTGDTVRNEFDILATVFDANIYEIKLEYKMAFQNQWITLRKDTISYLIENQPIRHWDNLTDSGSVKIMLTASDKAGNVDIDSTQFLFDNKEYARPMAMISTPADSDYVNDWINVRGSATDDNFTKYQLFLRNQTIDTLLVESDIKKENEILTTFYSRAFPDGEYKLVLTAFNKKLYHKTAIRSIFIDNSPPTADIFYPSSGDTISCTVQIHGEAYDENFESLTLRYARATEKDTSKFILIDSTFTDWNTMELNGVYNLYLTAEDIGGLTTIDELTCYIDNPIYDDNEGLLKEQDEVSLYLAPNGYHSSVICIEKISIDNCPCDSLKFTPTDLIFEIQSSIDDNTFDKPAVLSIAYDSLDLNQYDKDKLGVCHYKNNEWHLIGGTLNKDKSEITTGIDEIGIYGLFEKERDIVIQVDKLEVSCQPRVFSPNDGSSDTQTSIMFELGEEKSATIKIYNTAGRLIRLLKENERMQIGENSVPWDGRGQNGSVCVTGLYVVSVKVEDKLATQTVVVMNK